MSSSKKLNAPLATRPRWERSAFGGSNQLPCVRRKLSLEDISGSRADLRGISSPLLHPLGKLLNLARAYGKSFDLLRLRLRACCKSLRYSAQSDESRSWGYRRREASPHGIFQSLICRDASVLHLIERRLAKMQGCSVPATDLLDLNFISKKIRNHLNIIISISTASNLLLNL